MTDSERIQARIAGELDLKKSRVNEVISTMFDFITENMENGDLRPIRMQYLGLWECKPLRIQKLKEKGLL